MHFIAGAPSMPPFLSLNIISLQQQCDKKKEKKSYTSLDKC